MNGRPFRFGLLAAVAAALILVTPHLASAAGCATPDFVNSTAVPVGDSPNSIAAADFNGDGHLDLATINSGSGDVSVVLGAGTGSFGAAAAYSVGGNPHSVAIGDFNGDGNVDLAVANQRDNTVSILLGTGTGSFGSPTNYAVGTNPYSVGVRDLNADGSLDLAVADAAGTGNTLFILSGNGSGSFGPPTGYAVDRSASVAIGDFNEDRNLDVALANFASNTVSVLLGGGGRFRAPVSYDVGNNPVSVATGDFNADGRLDLTVANNGNLNVFVLLGSGDGRLGTPTSYVSRPASGGSFMAAPVRRAAAVQHFIQSVSPVTAISVRRAGACGARPTIPFWLFRPSTTTTRWRSPRCSAPTSCSWCRTTPALPSAKHPTKV